MEQMKNKWLVIIDKYISDVYAKEYEWAHNGMKIDVSLSREELQELRELIVEG